MRASQSDEKPINDKLPDRSIKHAVTMLQRSHTDIRRQRMDRTITINKRFDLKYDDLGDKWIVEKGISKTGNETQKVFCGYHWHFASLLKSFSKKRLPEKDATTVKGALRAMAEAQADMEKLAEVIGKALDEKWQK